MGDCRVRVEEPGHQEPPIDIDPMEGGGLQQQEGESLSRPSQQGQEYQLQMPDQNSCPQDLGTVEKMLCAIGGQQEVKFRVQLYGIAAPRDVQDGADMPAILATMADNPDLEYALKKPAQTDATFKTMLEKNPAQLQTASSNVGRTDVAEILGDIVEACNSKRAAPERAAEYAREKVVRKMEQFERRQGFPDCVVLGTASDCKQFGPFMEALQQAGKIALCPFVTTRGSWYDWLASNFVRMPFDSRWMAKIKSGNMSAWRRLIEECVEKDVAFVMFYTFAYGTALRAMDEYRTIRPYGMNEPWQLRQLRKDYEHDKETGIRQTRRLIIVVPDPETDIPSWLKKLAGENNIIRFGDKPCETGSHA